ncbi:MAG: MFS transporter, partial [Oceanospirillum sp.]|nr:MFS transporter [Oceanospirillum sp.]
MNLRNVLLLAMASALAMSAAPVVIFIGGLIGGDLSPDPRFATLPVAFMVIGTALSTIPAAMIMQRLGRKRGFILGATGGVLANLLAAFALSINSFALFVTATALVGFHLAFVQQYRFAAAESASPEQTGKAISFVLVGGVIAAFIGPELAQVAAHWFEQKFVGSFVVLALLIVLALLLLLMIKPVQDFKA